MLTSILLMNKNPSVSLSWSSTFSWAFEACLCMEGTLFCLTGNIDKLTFKEIT